MATGLGELVNIHRPSQLSLLLCASLSAPEFCISIGRRHLKNSLSSKQLQDITIKTSPTTSLQFHVGFPQDSKTQPLRKNASIYLFHCYRPHFRRLGCCDRWHLPYGNRVVSRAAPSRHLPVPQPPHPSSSQTLQRGGTMQRTGTCLPPYGRK